MSDDNQEQFLKSVRTALGYELSERRSKTVLPLHVIDGPTQEENGILLQRLIEEGEKVNASVIIKENSAAVTSAIVELVEQKDPEWGDKKSVAAWKHPLIESLDLSDALHEHLVPVYYTELKEESTADQPNPQHQQKERLRIREEVADSYIGVTSADFCVADTATLVMKTRIGQARSVSLLPSIHIAVIKQEQIVPDLKTLYYYLKNDSRPDDHGLSTCLTFVTGPSKTRDIEGEMVFGAHGPRELYLFVIKSET